jgi:hypothetical protein
MKQIFHYLISTKNLQLTYGRELQDLTGFTDADGASQPHRHIISGYAFFIDSSVVSWHSRKQELITTDTTDISIGKPTKDPKAPQARHLMAFLIYNILANDAQLLSGRKVWVGKNIAFEATPFLPQRPLYIFTLKGLTTNSEKNIKNLVLNTWKDP